ncbi:MAG: hypothetical protein IJC83_00905, partial [Oscillospiraceae bacterium]|nr:hypothetical protein [Oscillospiraceae bacterium]
AKVYGKNPVFIFNENDKRNAVPDDEMYDYVKSMWEIAPSGLKVLFNEAFVEGIQNPRKRVIEQKWIKALGVLLDTISHCPHDNAENFWYDDKQGGIRKIRCWYCGDEYDAPPRIKIKNKNNNMVIARIAVKPNTKLLLRHIESNVDSADAEIVLGELVQHPADRNVWGLRNTSDDVWQFENSKGVVTEIPNGKTVPIFKDNKVMFSDLVVAEFEM